MNHGLNNLLSNYLPTANKPALTAILIPNG